MLAVYISNCCLHNPDRKPATIPGDLSVNEMESELEIILEQLPFAHSTLHHSIFFLVVIRVINAFHEQFTIVDFRG